MQTINARTFIARQDGETALFEAINEERVKRRLTPFRVSKCLTEQALKHAVHMREQRRLSHDKSDQRMEACGIWRGAENVAAAPTVQDVIGWRYWFWGRGWLGSKLHRENMLGDYQMCGTGRADMYWCAIFGTAF